jgi:hypothetical protein
MRTVDDIGGGRKLGLSLVGERVFLHEKRMK